jgi:hypothetical protein
MRSDRFRSTFGDRRGVGKPGEPGPTAHPDEVWLDVDRRLRRGELSATAAIKELSDAGLIEGAEGVDVGDPDGVRHWVLRADGFHGPVLLMATTTFAGPRLFAPLHRESDEEARRRH